MRTPGKIQIDDNGDHNSYYIENEDQVFIGMIFSNANKPEHEKDEESYANAQFIVRAWNAHDELILAAKEACIMIAEIAKVSAPGMNVLMESPGLIRLLHAINRAEGKPEDK